MTHVSTSAESIDRMDGAPSFVEHHVEDGSGLHVQLLP
jgi:hypothetical protein